jgi:hypothetical protein
MRRGGLANLPERSGSSHSKTPRLRDSRHLTAIDMIYVAKRLISKIYLVDAAIELLIIRRWLKTA